MRLVVPSRIAGLAPSRAGWLQLAACGVLALAWFRGETSTLSLTDSQLATRIPAPSASAHAGPQPVALGHRPAVNSAGLGLSTIEVIVGRNDTLDRIFRKLELNVADLASLRSLPTLRGRLDRLYPGESLTFTHRNGELVGLERDLSFSEKLAVVRGDDGFQAELKQKPFETRVQMRRAVITSSLFQAAADADIGDGIAFLLADIFRYDVDFALDIRPGDEFSVVYEEIYQNGVHVKDGPILAARFVNDGHEYRAVRYVGPDGEGRYYAPDGRSLRKAFLRAPLAFSRVSSGFASGRFHPLLNRMRAHKGVDYAAPTGTPVRAAGEGRVTFVGRKSGFGNVIEISHAGGVSTVYGHLSRFARGLRAGQRVEQGRVIGAVGMTGLATGPHLHYEYRVNGVHKNPQTVKLPDARPIDPALADDFVRRTAPLLASLDPQPGPALVAR